MLGRVSSKKGETLTNLDLNSNDGIKDETDKRKILLTKLHEEDVLGQVLTVQARVRCAEL